MKFRIPAALAFGFFLLLSVGTVRADGSGLLAYSLTGPTDVTFELPDTFSVAGGNYGLGEGFFVTPLDLTIDGTPVSGDFLIFCSSSMGGAFEDSDGLVNLTGSQLYTGPENDPTMSGFPGGTPLFDFNTGAGGYTLTVTPSVATPEPTSVILMGTGLLSLFLKRWRKVTR
jgi:PEP-CTERM motif